MKRTLFILLAAALTLLTSPRNSHACFDTYLFMQGRGMVYPLRMLVFDGSGEYVVKDLRGAEPDVFTGSLNVYYGLAEDISVQASLSSTEKERTRFGFDEWGLRAVYGIVERPGGNYHLDFILECHSAAAQVGSLYEFSLPSIWHFDRYTFVAHPAAAFGRTARFTPRAHFGTFYKTANGLLVGVGAEYESAQSSTDLGKRLVTGKGGTSLFFGAQVSPAFYLQNELIKGWGAGSSGGDVGFAVTLKFLKPLE